jgi:RimJ/RimL family protein N-acetyltransferase
MGFAGSSPAARIALAEMDPLLMDIPATLTTSRLTLRVPAASDSAIIYPSACASAEQLKRWLPWAGDALSEQNTETWCRKASAEFITRAQLQYIIFRREDNLHLGNIGALRFDWQVPRGEIGYWLRSDQWGNGYMSEAVNALAAMLFDTLRFNRVEIRVDERNERSWRVAQRCGFEFEGVLRNEFGYADGSLRNTRVYARVTLA